ncbi:YibE/F family protein [Sporichthya sp.]|uniref:YibE/F family protein n=1 Tax=Sporichthya sp. TaxID=65475 RepID=UPI001792F679|nr:YibE/F family protein [Sporichthya sp.]MBA3742609.1 YibE/F family protein [Sporichthya sp.]
MTAHGSSPGHGHGHSHGNAADAPAAPAGSGRLLALLLVPAALAALIAMVVLWPGEQRSTNTQGLDQDLARGTVTAIHPGDCGPGPTACPQADVRITGGPGEGQTVSVPAPAGIGAPTLAGGDKIVMVYGPDAPPGSQYQVIDFQRGSPLLLLALLFVAVVIIAGRWQGLAALGGLIVSFAVLVLFVLPAILNGSSPLLVAVAGSAVIMFAVLYLTHGVNVWTSVAVLGTLGALLLTGVLGLVFTNAAHFTGLASENAGMISASYPDVDVRGLLLAGIIIGSLGVLDDVTVTQAVTVAELHRADPAMPRTALFAAANRVGRAHIASTVNTLVLAYAGASLPLLLLFTAGGRSTADLLTSEVVATEVVRTAVGSIGILAAVPLTTWLAVAVLPSPAASAGSRSRGRRRKFRTTAWSRRG